MKDEPTHDEMISCLFQAVLVKSREQVADELSRLQRDNESLQGKHRLHTELQQQEDFQMPNAVQVREAPVILSPLLIQLFSCVLSSGSESEQSVLVAQPCLLLLYVMQYLRVKYSRGLFTTQQLVVTALRH